MTAQHGGQTPGAEVAQRTFVSDEEQTAAMPPPGGAEEQSAETREKQGKAGQKRRLQTHWSCQAHSSLRRKKPALKLK